jgi:hypothetical protein
MRSKRYRMRGCSRRRHKGGDANLNLAYTGHGSHQQSIANPFLAYTGKGGCGGGGGEAGSCPFMKGGGDAACNSSAPADAATFLAYDGKGLQKGGCHGIRAPVGGVTAAMLGAAEVVSSAANLPTQMGGMGTGGVTAAMLGAAEVVSSAPDVATQQMGGGGGVATNAAPVTGYPTPGPDANVALSDSGSVYSGSAPYLVTGGMAPDIARAYPSTAGTPAHIGWINNQTLQGGGGCGCGVGPLTLGGGRRRRRRHTRRRRHRGGRNFGDPVPNGLLGQSWTGNVATWPGVDGVAMNRGHYDLNTYANDVSRQTQDIGANFPFSGLSWKGGRGRRRRRTRTRTHRRRSTRRHKGGALSNYLSQDIINLGREFGFSTQSAYNTLAGQPAPVNPMPWKDQLVSVPHK